MKKTGALILLGAGSAVLAQVRSWLANRAEAAEDRPDKSQEAEVVDADAEALRLTRAEGAIAAYKALLAESQPLGDLPPGANTECRKAWTEGRRCPYKHAAFACRRTCALSDEAHE